MNEKTKQSCGLAVVFFIAFALRLAAILILPAQPWEQETIALNMLSGNGFTYAHLGGVVYSSYCEPLYPYLSAAVYALTAHNVFVLEVIQALFSAAACLVVFFCAKRIFSMPAAWIAALLVAVHPGLIVYTAKLHPLNLDVFFISLTLLALMRLAEDTGNKNLIIAGLVSGICMLTRPTIIVFVPLALAYIFSVNTRAFLKCVKYAVVFCFFFAAVFLPWGLRNYRVQGQFMLTRSNAPYVFWLGNNPHNFSGSALDIKGRDIYDLAPQEFRNQVEGLDELGQNRLFRKEALAYIRGDPMGFLARTLKKFYYFWWFSPQAGILYPKLWLGIYKIFYALALICGILGVLWAFKQGNRRRARESAVLAALLVISVSLFQSLFYVEVRHRWAIEPVFLIFSAGGLVYCLNWVFWRTRNENH